MKKLEMYPIITDDRNLQFIKMDEPEFFSELRSPLFNMKGNKAAATDGIVIWICLTLDNFGRGGRYFY